MSRLEINRHIHESLQAQGKIGSQDHALTILINRHELTGADREWADRYDPGNVIRYTRGSSRIGIKEGELRRANVPYLLKNLPGYADYMQGAPYRLIPGIW